MLLGRVIGTVVPATLVDELTATPLLWVQPLDKQGQPDGDPLVCADGTRMAGPGQVIYWVASREAALTLGWETWESEWPAGRAGEADPTE